MSFEIVSEFRAWQIWQHSSCMQVCLITLGPLLHWSFRRVILGQCCRSFAAGNASPRSLRLSEKQQKQFIFQFPIYFRSVCFCYVYIYIYVSSCNPISHQHLTFLTVIAVLTDQRRKTFAVHIPYFALITPFLFGKIVRFFAVVYNFTTDFFCKICFKCLFHLSLGHGQVHSLSASIFLKLKFSGFVKP